MRPASTLAALVVAAFVAGSGLHPAHASGWRHWHGGPDNMGFVPVTTAAAVQPRTLEIGEVASGSGPVIGGDGTVYVGVRSGAVVALAPDLRVKWRRDTQGEILASPIIGADGSIYVIGVQTVRDHRSGQTVTAYRTRLHKFDSGGGLHWVTPLPADRTGREGHTSAPLNMWRARGQEVIIVPIRYQGIGGGRYTNLLALSTSGGGALANVQVNYVSAVVTGGFEGFGCSFLVCSNFAPPPGTTLPKGTALPMPGVALYSARGSDPFVVLPDGHQDIIGYSFSPEAGFRETFRRHITNDRGLIMATPLMLDDGHSITRAYFPLPQDSSAPNEVPSKAWLLSAGPNNATWPDYQFEGLGSTPAMMADGRIVTAGTLYFRGDSSITVLRNLKKDAWDGQKAETLGPPAVSANHVFVAFTNKIRTYDAATLALVTEHPWTGGGHSPPAIADDGRVYAVAGSTLYAFAGTKTCVGIRCNVRRPFKRPREGALDRVN